MRYLRDLTLPNDAHKIVLEEYMQAIDTCIDRVERLTDKLKQLLPDWEWEPVVRALMACKGFQEVAAMTVVSELGDLRRFPHPRQLMAFLGLIPGEHSSGSKRQQGGITKCGNAHVRWMLVECSQHFRRAPKISGALTSRQIGQSKEVKELSWRMQNRLSKRYRALRARGIRDSKCVVAVARELAAFIWERPAGTASIESFSGGGKWTPHSRSGTQATAEQMRARNTGIIHSHHAEPLNHRQTSFFQTAPIPGGGRF